MGISPCMPLLSAVAEGPTRVVRLVMQGLQGYRASFQKVLCSGAISNFRFALALAPEYSLLRLQPTASSIVSEL